MSYWPIMGYGVALQKNMFDPQKVEDVLSIVNDGEDDFLLDDVLEAVCRLPEAKGLVWGCTAEMWCDPIWYFYCPALVPWVARLETWRNMTPEKVEQVITDILAPVLRDGTQLTFDEIADVGCG